MSLNNEVSTILFTKVASNMHVSIIVGQVKAGLIWKP